MAQYHVTIDSELLQHLFLSDTRDSGVSKLLESILNQILEAQATEQLRAAPYERTEERQGYRNTKGDTVIVGYRRLQIL